ncbi:hypothetical protein BH11CYA1_BH11CYA1_30650 [soil metagenome]
MDSNTVILLLTAAGLVYGLVRMFTSMNDSGYGSDLTRMEQSENNFDFKAVQYLLVAVAIGGAIWLLSGNFATPIGKLPALTSTPTTRALGAATNLIPSTSSLPMWAIRKSPLRLITPSR